MHKKLIKRGGKVFGPYYYTTYRENGRIKTRYLGIAPKKDETISFWPIILAILIFLAGAGLIFNEKIFTGRVIENGMDLTVQETAVSECQSLNATNTVYILNQNVQANETCFNVNASNVTLNCNGYSIIGNRSGAGVNSTGQNDLTVKNCLINNESIGLFLQQSNRSKVYNNSFYNIQGLTGIENLAADQYGGTGNPAISVYIKNSNSVNISNNLIINNTGGNGGQGGYNGASGKGGDSVAIYAYYADNITIASNVIINITAGNALGYFGSSIHNSGGNCIGLFVYSSNNSYLSKNNLSNLFGGAGSYSTATGGVNVLGIGGASIGIHAVNSTINATSNIIANLKGGTGGNGQVNGIGTAGGMSIGLLINNSRQASLFSNTILNVTGGTGGTMEAVAKAGSIGGLSSGIEVYASNGTSLFNNTITNILGGIGGNGGSSGGAGGNGSESWGIYLYYSNNINLTSTNIINITGGPGGTGGGGGATGSAGAGLGIYLISSSSDNLVNNLIYSLSTYLVSISSSNNTFTNITFNGTIGPVKASFAYFGDLNITPPSAIADSGGLTNISKYLNITNQTAANVLLNISYNDIDWHGRLNTDFLLKMYKHNGSEWINANASSDLNQVDLKNKVVYANITSFSIFAVMGVNDNLFPSVNLTAPPNDTTSGQINQTFRCNASDSLGLSNVTLYIWNISNGVYYNNTFGISGTANLTEWNVSISLDGNYTWNCLVYDAASNSNRSGENYTVMMDLTPPYTAFASPQNRSYALTQHLINITNSSDAQAVWWFNGTDNSTFTAVKYLNFSEGSHTLYAYANDSFGNLNTTSVTFFIDFVSPTITIVYPVQNSSLAAGTTATWINVSTNEVSECRYNLTNSTFAYLNGTSFNNTNSTAHSFYYTGLSAGTRNIYYKCNDSAGNLNNASTTHTFTISSSSSTSGESGGGGGGGGAYTPEENATAEETKESFTQTFEKINASEPITITLSEKISLKTGLSKITVTTNTDLEEVEFNSATVMEKEVSVKPQNVYSYFSINAVNINETQIQKAEISFEINKSWVESMGFDKDKIHLLRFHQEQWQLLETEMAEPSETSYKYKAISPGFSVFAITAEKKEEAQGTQQPEPVVSRTNVFFFAAWRIVVIIMLSAAWVRIMRYLIKTRKQKEGINEIKSKIKDEPVLSNWPYKP